MAELETPQGELRKGIKLKIGEKHVITVLKVARVRMTGMFFDLNKCFMLPSAVPGVKRLSAKYKQHPGANLLIVGHTDTSGQDADNLALSLERADAIGAYLKDDTAAWDAFFAAGKGDTKRWGTREIQLMLSQLPDGADPGSEFFPGTADGKDSPATKAAIKAFQESESISPATGTADAATRKKIIERYMGIDGTTLPSGSSLTTHGCGENFPAAQIKDGAKSPEDRRAEIFIFEGPIAPPPPGKTSKKGSAEYPQWVAQVTSTVDFSADKDGNLRAGPFKYGVPVGVTSPWSEKATLRIKSVDGTDERAFPMATGEAVGDHRVFAFPDAKPGLKYNGFMEQGESAIAVFGPVELRRVADPFDDVSELPPPDAAPAPVEKPEDPPTADTLTGQDPAVTDPQAVANASVEKGEEVA